jgi:prolyl-tRNA synthetase
MKDEEQRAFGEKLYEELKGEGIEVIFDDRAERFGPKIKDFELIGFPYGVIIGKGLKEGKVQVVERKTLEKVELDKEAVKDYLVELLKK